MENQKQNQLVFIDEKGEEVLCNILFTFDSDEFNKSYVLFYPVGDLDDDDDQVEVAAASYVPEKDGSVGELFAIETDEEWALIEEVLASFDNDEDCCCDDCCDDDCCDDDCCSDDECDCCHHKK